MKKAFVFIDGANFYFKLKDLLSKIDGKYSLLNFGFRRFAEWLVKPNKLIEVRYYIGALKQGPNNPKSKQIYTDQQRLFRKLQRQNIIVKTGQIIRHPDKTYHEKGVDVRLAVEMIKFARKDQYDIAYLVSSDTDLVPAVEEVKAFNKTIQYVGIPKGQSFGLSKVSNDVRLLRPEDIKQFLPEKLLI